MKRIYIAIALVQISAIFNELRAETPPRMSKMLLRSTVRIEADKPDGGHVGTGFFYAFDRTPSSAVPAIVTCAHLITNATVGRIIFAQADNVPANRGTPQLPLVLQNFSQYWIFHPSADVAIMPIGAFMAALEKAGVRLDFIPFSDETLPTREEMESAEVFQEVKMIGYPIGIWDATHNLPIARRGMLATDITLDYNGKPDFLIDIAVYPGSSGSPVLVAEEGSQSYGPQFMRIPDKLKLLGITYAQHLFTAEGSIEVQTIPTAFEAKARTSIPANLAIVVRSEVLRDFVPILRQRREMENQQANKGLQAIGTNAPQPEP